MAIENEIDIRIVLATAAAIAIAIGFWLAEKTRCDADPDSRLPPDALFLGPVNVRIRMA